MTIVLPPEGFDETDWRGWRRVPGLEGHRVAFFRGASAPNNAWLEPALVEAAQACELPRDHDQQAPTAFTVFPEPFTPAGADEPLVHAWAETVGGELERRPSKRDATVAEILAAHPFLRPLVDKWQRLMI